MTNLSLELTQFLLCEFKMQKDTVLLAHDYRGHIVKPWVAIIKVGYCKLY